MRTQSDSEPFFALHICSYSGAAMPKDFILR